MNKDIERIKKIILNEWKEHKNNYIVEEMWFECPRTEQGSYTYDIGFTINYTDATTGKETERVLKTKKDVLDYKKEEMKIFGYCDVCERFKNILKELEKIEGGFL